MSKEESGSKPEVEKTGTSISSKDTKNGTSLEDSTKKTKPSNRFMDLEEREFKQSATNVLNNCSLLYFYSTSQNEVSSSLYLGRFRLFLSFLYYYC